MNAILDGWPEEYKGYLIRTDYRIGIQISQCLMDNEYDESEKIATALTLLYGYGIPADFEVAMSGLSWFLNCGEKRKNLEDEAEKEDVFDFDIDSGRIITAFLRFYNIDLTRTGMHWFQFLAMLSDLGECAFINVMNYRTAKITTDMSAEQRKTYELMKRKYSLVEYTDEEQESINNFLMELENAKIKQEPCAK